MYAPPLFCLCDCVGEPIVSFGQLRCRFFDVGHLLVNLQDMLYEPVEKELDEFVERVFLISVDLVEVDVVELLDEGRVCGDLQGRRS